MSAHGAGSSKGTALSQGLVALAVALTIGGWLTLGAGVGIWLWLVAVVALVSSCVLCDSWRGIALRVGVTFVVFVTFPLVVNLAVYLLDVLGVVDRDSGGSEPAR